MFLCSKTIKATFISIPETFSTDAIDIKETELMRGPVVVYSVIN